MINLAIFLDFKQNEMTTNSKSLLNYVIYLGENNADINIYLCTIQEIDHCFVPQKLNINYITSFVTKNNVYFSSNGSLEALIGHLKSKEISHIFFSKSTISDNICAKISTILGFNLITNVKSLKVENDLFYFSKSIFSGKALAKIDETKKQFIAIFQKGFTGDFLSEDSNEVKEIKVEKLMTSYQGTSTIIDESYIQGEIQLSDAEIVVGAGRGLKDPNNWAIIEKLASTIKAATACSKPVSDLNWRPHHEHVGQTGIKINPKLYIACGISGAIQHLAGVNGSGIIVVINNDPEAAFIKHADYIVLGDLFEIVPQLTKLLNEV